MSCTTAHYVGWRGAAMVGADCARLNLFTSGVALPAEWNALLDSPFYFIFLFVYYQALEIRGPPPVPDSPSSPHEVQRKMLRRKQAEMLAAARPLVVGEEHHMDEPALWLLLPLLLFIARQSIKGRGLAKG